jgi:putative transposase
MILGHHQIRSYAVGGLTFRMFERSQPPYDLLMSHAKCQDIEYINFLIASPLAVTCTEAAAVQPSDRNPPAHDAFNRLLYRLEPDAETLWQEARPLVHRSGGVLVLDDSILDKPYARKIQMVGYHWSGKHHAVVRGINLITLLWTDGDRQIPCDYRTYDKAKDGLTKNDHFRAMLQRARSRGFVPDCVLFDGWYSSTENLKTIREFGWRWLTRLKANRHVNLDRQGLKPVGLTAIAAGGTVVQLEGYGLVRVFSIVSRDGDREYWATNDLEMGELERLRLSEWSWSIENYHRGLKQCCGVEKAQVRGRHAQRNHIGLAIRAFLRLEHHAFTTGVSWYEAKARIIRGAVRAYLAKPLYNLPSTA